MLLVLPKPGLSKDFSYIKAFFILGDQGVASRDGELLLDIIFQERENFRPKFCHVVSTSCPWVSEDESSSVGGFSVTSSASFLLAFLRTVKPSRLRDILEVNLKVNLEKELELNYCNRSANLK